MLDFLSDYADPANVVINTVMVLIWAIYLQIFLMNHLRQGRSFLHIDLGAADGVRSRCLVTNLGASPVYIQGIVAELSCDGHTSRTRITDREEVSPEDLDDPLARTYRGTLQPGQTVDIGSLEDLVSRARIRLAEDWISEDVDAVTITAVAIAGQTDRIVAAAKTFDADTAKDERTFVAQSMLTQQIRPRQTQARFSEMMADRKFE